MNPPRFPRLAPLALALVPVLVSVLVTRCSAPDGSGAEGGSGARYHGSLPSPLAQNELRKLRGEVVVDLAGVLGGGDWEIGPYSVCENPVSAGGFGPVVQLEQDSETRYVPILKDADVGDLYFKVHTKHLGGGFDDEEPSAAYRAVWNR